MNFYPHQNEALNCTKSFDKVAYYMDMGLGKTFVGAEKMSRLGAVTNLLICQKSKIDDWMQHFNTYYPQIKLYNLTKKEQLSEFILHDVAWNGYHGGLMVVGVIN